MSIHQSIIDGYLQDAPKYARRAQIKYVELILQHIPHVQSERFKTAKIPGEYRKRELAPAIDLFEKAGIAHRIYHTGAHGVPLAAESDLEKYKLILLDVALAQRILGADQRMWILNPKEACINKGPIVEAFVGQELLAYRSDFLKRNLHYWQRETRGSNAEVDYIESLQREVIPIEVKSDRGTSLKSLHLFLDCHPNVNRAVRFSTHEYSIYEKIHSYPLYSVASIFSEHKQALLDLLV